MKNFSAALLTLAIAGTAAAQPVFTQLPVSNSPYIIGLHISEDGQTCAGFVANNTSFIWRANAFPQIQTYTGGNLDNGSGMIGGFVGMDETGNRFLVGYRDPAVSPSSTWVGGLGNAATLENGQYSVIAPPAIAQGCDLWINTPTALSGDGEHIMAMAWNTCAVAPFMWTEASGWTPWATLDTIPPFGQPGYDSHKVVSVSRDGSRGAGWFQSGTGYGGRTALVWTNNGTTVSRLDSAPHSVLWGQATAISADGRYVAGTGIPEHMLPPGETLEASGNKFLYRWNEATGVEVLGKVDTAPGSLRHPSITGISRNGRIIVGLDSFGGDREGFIWTPESGGVKLTTYLATKGLDLNAQFLYIPSVGGMSSDGRFITGQWANFGGEFGPFILDMGPQGCNGADLGGQGGTAEPDYRLDNNDFVVFIDLFFSGLSRADLGAQGGVPGHDGAFDNNDFVVFIDVFFQGC